MRLYYFIVWEVGNVGKVFIQRLWKASPNFLLPFSPTSSSLSFMYVPKKLPALFFFTLIHGKLYVFELFTIITCTHLPHISKNIYWSMLLNASTQWKGKKWKWKNIQNHPSLSHVKLCLPEWMSLPRIEMLLSKRIHLSSNVVHPKNISACTPLVKLKTHTVRIEWEEEL